MVTHKKEEIINLMNLWRFIYMLSYSGSRREYKIDQNKKFELNEKKISLKF